MTQVSTNQSLQRDPLISKILAQRPAAPLEQLDQETGNWLQNLREQSASWVSRLTLPTRRDEEWRFTDISELLNWDIVQSPKCHYGNDIPWNTPIEKSGKFIGLTFLNGFYTEELSDISGLPEGIYVGNLTNLPEAFCKYFRPFLGTLPGKEEVFTSLNTSSISDVAIIWAAPNTVVEQPIYLSFITVTDDQVTFSQPRCWIVAEKDCQLTIVEEYQGTGTYLTNSVSEVFLGENAQINQTRWQHESATAYHIGKTVVNQKQDSRYTLNEINLGGKLARYTPEVNQDGAQTTTNLNGLAIAKNDQTSDTHSLIRLNHPHGVTDQLHKCIVDDRAHTVFNGKVFVPKPAQMTDAKQLNRNLLLSSKARVDTKPELQITADNVKCSHGATVSQLESDEIFYLRSRGLSEDDARQLLIDAFVGEILERVPVDQVRKQIRARLFA